MWEFGIANKLYKKNSYDIFISSMFSFGIHKIIMLREYYTPNKKIACFVLDLKIINTLLKNNICILK